MGIFDIFKQKSAAEQFLYRELGRKDPQLNRIISGVPEFTSQIYNQARDFSANDLKNIITDFGERLGNREFYRTLEADKIKSLEINIVSFLLYLSGKNLNTLIKNEQASSVIINAIAMDLQKYTAAHISQITKYTKPELPGSSNEEITATFVRNLSTTITRKPDIAFTTALKAIPTVMEEKSAALVKALTQDNKE